MAKIHFVDHTGEKRTIEVENGATVPKSTLSTIPAKNEPLKSRTARL